MNITDINCFVGYDNSSISNRYTEKMLLEKMNKYHIDSAVVYDKLSIFDHYTGNLNAKKLSEKCPDKITHCYVLSPNLDTKEMPSAEKLCEILKNDKPSAIRLFPTSNGFIVDSFYCGELLEIIDSMRIPLILEEGIDFSTLPHLAADYPNIPFVLLGVGLRCTDYIRPLITKRDNVYFDTAYTVDAGFLDEIVNKCGSEKFLFGSGMPHMEPSGILSMIIYGGFSDYHKENILSGNWQRIQEAIKWA